MSQMLKQLLHEEAERIDIPPAPVRAIVVGGRRRRTVRHTQVLVAVAASVAIFVGGSVGVTRLLADGGQVQPSPVGPPSSPGSPSAARRHGCRLRSRCSSGTRTPGGPDEYGRIPGNQGYFQDAEDNLSPSWAYRFTAVSCWQVFCVVYGGDDADSLKLRGWELAQYNRWSDGGRLKDLTSPDVRLADSRVGLGDSGGSSTRPSRPRGSQTPRAGHCQCATHPGRASSTASRSGDSRATGTPTGRATHPMTRR